MSEELLDINACTVEELKNFTGISDSLAQEIIKHRDQNGAFYHLSEILDVPNVDRSGFLHITGVEPEKAERYVLRHHIKKITKQSTPSGLTFKDLTKMLAHMPSLAGAIICAPDGLPLSSDFAPNLPVDKFSAALSSSFKQMNETIGATDCGGVKSMTLDIADHTLTVFNSNSLYLIVIHKPRQFSSRVVDLCRDLFTKFKPVQQ